MINKIGVIKVRTPSLIIKLGRRPVSSGGSNGPRRIDGPDPDALRSPNTFFGAADALISGILAAAGSYSTLNSMNIRADSII